MADLEEVIVRPGPSSPAGQPPASPPRRPLLDLGGAEFAEAEFGAVQAQCAAGDPLACQTVAIIQQQRAFVAPPFFTLLPEVVVQAAPVAALPPVLPALAALGIVGGFATLFDRLSDSALQTAIGRIGGMVPPGGPVQAAAPAEEEGAFPDFEAMSRPGLRVQLEEFGSALLRRLPGEIARFLYDPLGGQLAEVLVGAPRGLSGGLSFDPSLSGIQLDPFSAPATSRFPTPTGGIQIATPELDFPTVFEPVFSPASPTLPSPAPLSPPGTAPLRPFDPFPAPFSPAAPSPFSPGSPALEPFPSPSTTPVPAPLSDPATRPGARPISQPGPAPGQLADPFPSPTGTPLQTPNTRPLSLGSPTQLANPSPFRSLFSDPFSLTAPKGAGVRYRNRRCACPKCEKKDKKKRKKKPRTECYSGTYRESAKSLSKSPRKKIPCLRSK